PSNESGPGATKAALVNIRSTRVADRQQSTQWSPNEVRYPADPLGAVVDSLLSYTVTNCCPAVVPTPTPGVVVPTGATVTNWSAQAVLGRRPPHTLADTHPARPVG